MTNNYENKQAARKERLLERADKAEQRASTVENAATERADMIPMGQPILVGHHSERRHRRDLDRIHRGFDKALEERGKAEELRRRAAAVGRGGISSDDPSAISKLEEKLRGLEESREQMKTVNAAWRKAGKPAPDNGDGWTRVGELTGLEAKELQNLRLQVARFGFGSDTPYPSYALRNLSSEARRVRVRIEQLHEAAKAVALDEDHGVCRLVEDPDDNRLRLFFDGKPSEAVRTILKRNGFRWSRLESAWQRHLNNAGRYAASTIIRQLKEMQS
ncbi:MAG: DUF3560 domain-containing protein [Planctomycetota bacterium]